MLSHIVPTEALLLPKTIQQGDDHILQQQLQNAWYQCDCVPLRKHAETKLQNVNK